MSKDGLSGLAFKEGESDFIKFEGGKSYKVRVLSTDPVITEKEFVNGEEVNISTKYGFAVWSLDEDRPMILNATPSVAKQIHNLHVDPDYGEDISILDIKIVVTGELLERRYTVQVLPKAIDLTGKQVDAVAELDKKLDTILKGIRASEFNTGAKPPKQDEVIEVDDDTDLSKIFPED